MPIHDEETPLFCVGSGRVGCRDVALGTGLSRYRHARTGRIDFSRRVPMRCRAFGSDHSMTLWARDYFDAERFK